jgi:hypothetical protein
VIRKKNKQVVGFLKIVHMKCVINRSALSPARADRRLPSKSAPELEPMYEANIPDAVRLKAIPVEYAAAFVARSLVVAA